MGFSNRGIGETLGCFGVPGVHIYAGAISDNPWVLADLGKRNALIGVNAEEL